MNRPAFRDWQSVRKEVLRRIHAREWVPGDLIPNEADLAEEFGCARTTVNRALRALAETGLLDRRRKAGTRIALQPVAKATLAIPIIRMEVEAQDLAYGYRLIERALDRPPAAISAGMKTAQQRSLLHLRALHLADNQPYAYEDRWINVDIVPAARDAPFAQISGNEWLLRHTPYTHGDIAFSAKAASEDEAKLLSCPVRSALFVIDRLTWDREDAVTSVRLLYPPGHRMRTGL